jgi:membrane protein YdbS with pleckstrin-like domain
MGKELKPSRLASIPNYLLALLLLSLFFIFKPDGMARILHLFTSVFILLLLLEPELKRRSSTYVLTPKAIIAIERGLTGEERVVLPFKSIMDLKVSQGLLGKLLGFGDLRLGSVKHRIEMKGVKDIGKVYEAIEARIVK